MNTNEQLAHEILCALDIAALRRVGVKTYEYFGQAPSFYDNLFPPSGDGPCVEPWQHSSMLEIFFDTAEQFFVNQEPGVISSGIWQEEGKTEGESALIALAHTLGREQIVIIRLLQDDFNARSAILGKARAQLLENRALTQSLEVYRKKSQVDSLTMLLNRAAFTDALPVAIHKSEFTRHPLSAIMLDIDDFKAINDTLGHLTGDRVLRELGRILRTNLRWGDIIARYGGEEFIIILPACGLRKAFTIAEKLRGIIENFAADDVPKFTVSMGCSLHHAGETPDSFIQRVDTALYAAKRKGKNRVCMC